MKMQNSRKILAAVLAAVVLCAFLSSALFIIHESEHNCEGEACRICAMLTVCRTVIRAFSVISAVCIVSILARIITYVINSRAKSANTHTPVSLRVKLLN